MDQDKALSRVKRSSGGRCPRLDPQARVSVVKGGQDYTAEGTTIKVVCGEGFRLTNTRSKFRCKGGEWRPGLPDCQPRDCPRLVVHHAEVSRINNTATVTCHSGYRMTGSPSVSCRAGSWQPHLPLCLGVPCHLDHVQHGQYLKYRAGDTIAHDTLLDYECDLGFARSHVRPVQCKTGSIVPSRPLCRELEDLSQDRHFILRQNEEPRVEDPINAPGTEMFLTYDDSLACSPPQQIDGGLLFMSLQEEDAEVKDYSEYSDAEPDMLDQSLYPAEEPEESYFQNLYPNGTVIRFQCSQTTASQYASWQISCEEGVWLGSYSPCSPAGNSLEEITAAGYKMPCLLSPPAEDSKLVAFYQDKEVTTDLTIPADQVVTLRCTDIGKFRLEGSQRRRCVGGHFSGEVTRCVGLNQEHEYKLDQPPTILFRHKDGPIAQSNLGELIVFPGTTLHMECLFLKRFGTPSWTSRRAGRENYPQGWAQGPGRDATLEYRLTIFQAEERDTGEFTCTTPTKQSHSINIIVMNITCPAIFLTTGLERSTDSNILNTSNGNSLLGPPSLTCLTTGKWSDVQPACEEIFCPDILDLLGDTKVLVDTETHEAGGSVRFSCPLNYELVGPRRADCLQSGHWSLGELRPTCVPVLCKSPPTPSRGTLVSSQPGQTSYRVGDIVQFHCHTGYMMVGSPVSACTQDKTWSLPPPQCVTACTYPGTSPGANIDVVKFYYSLGETVRFTCGPGLQLEGPPLLKCLDSGHWSGGVPACRQL